LIIRVFLSDHDVSSGHGLDHGFVGSIKTFAGITIFAVSRFLLYLIISATTILLSPKTSSDQTSFLIPG
jgi:hypothetical protein